MKTRKLIRTASLLVAISIIIGFSGCKSGVEEKGLAQGWNTWNTRSVLSHVLLPEGFALDLQLKNGETRNTLKEALIGRHGAHEERIKAGPHAYDGSYTDLEIEWQGMKLRIQTATKKDELYLLVTPLYVNKEDSLIISPQMIWGNKGELRVTNKQITARTASKLIELEVLGEGFAATNNAISVSLAKPISITQNTKADLTKIESVIEQSARSLQAQKEKYSKAPELYDAMQSVLAWDIIYEPTNERVIAPVSRIWNTGWGGGWILFDWDTYFAAYMRPWTTKNWPIQMLWRQERAHVSQGSL